MAITGASRLRQEVLSRVVVLCPSSLKQSYLLIRLQR
jgi:hypothetical protein